MKVEVFIFIIGQVGKMEDLDPLKQLLNGNHLEKKEIKRARDLAKFILIETSYRNRLLKNE